MRQRAICVHCTEGKDRWYKNARTAQKDHEQACPIYVQVGNKVGRKAAPSLDFESKNHGRILFWDLTRIREQFFGCSHDAESSGFQEGTTRGDFLHVPLRSWFDYSIIWTFDNMTNVDLCITNGCVLVDFGVRYRKQHVPLFVPTHENVPEVFW